MYNLNGKEIKLNCIMFEHTKKNKFLTNLIRYLFKLLN